MTGRLVVLFLLLWSSTGVAAPPAEAPARNLFLATDHALRAGEDVDLDEVLGRLGDYPLVPYLRLRQLSRDLDAAGAADIEALGEAHPQLPGLQQLQRDWLARRGERGDWDAFARLDQGQGGAQLTCYRLQARRATGDIDPAWLDSARELWTVGHSQPEACDPVFEELYRRDALPADRRWERIRRIMAAGRPGLARALAHRLDDEQQQWLHRWLRVTADPARGLDSPDFDPESPRGREIVEHGLKRLARSDPGQALETLARYRELMWIPPSRADRLQRHIALQAAYSAEPRALEWLRALPEEVVDGTVREWTARAALRAADWAALGRALAELPETLARQPEWRYWQAVGLEHQGRAEAARGALEALAGTRHYYGFLAADRLGQGYAMNHRPAPRNDAGVARLAAEPALVRVRELLAVGWYEEARREWYTALAGASPGRWADAAQLASDWGWHHGAVAAANRAGLRDALELRFPLAFRDRLPPFAEQAGVDPALAYAVARKESAFDPAAVSRVGARGLLQLMPGTARRVARSLDSPEPDAHALLDPELNLRLGSTYLGRMLERFPDRPAAAVAAYNAGPRAAEAWQRVPPPPEPALWVERITYGETRDYVKSVLAFRAVFDWRLTGRARPLSGLLGAAGEPELALGEAPGAEGEAQVQ